MWVITRRSNRRVIEAALATEWLPDVHFVYFDLPKWARFWKERERGLYLYYYLWQLGVYLVSRKLHREICFDVVHHVTFGTYWMPSFLALLPVPFVWGPVGGADATPREFRRSFSAGGRLYELLRDIAHGLGRLNPFVRLTARRAALGLASTPETQLRLRELGCRKTQVCACLGMTTEEIHCLDSLERPPHAGFRLASVGVLLNWKGFEFGLRAFARLCLEFPDSEYWLIGSGPMRHRLERLVHELGVEGKVRFWGELPRRETLEKLSQCDVLVHPSLHDSGGFVCSEAMAALRPVICLDVGGPGLQVTDKTGYKVPAISPAQVVTDLAAAMRRLASDPALRAQLGSAGRRRVEECFTWDKKGDYIDRVYSEATNCSQAPVRVFQSVH